MITLRCTEKLRKKLRLPALSENAPPSTAVLGDWFGNPVSTRHARVILLVNERSRLAVLVPARQLDQFERRFADATANAWRSRWCAIFVSNWPNICATDWFEPIGIFFDVAKKP